MAQKIGTHSGSFHCDEALACYLLLQTPKFSGSEIIRSRDPKVLDTCDILVDVGAVYDPKENKFDHHQRGFEETFSSKHHTKLSSAGLVYKHFGREVVKALSGCDDANTEIIYQKMYTNFIEGLDGIDNGVARYPADVEAKYKVGTDLSARVGKMNPRWNEEGVDTMALFHKASAMAGEEFKHGVEYLAKGWLPARAIVEQALVKRTDEGKTGEVIMLPQFCPWQSHLFDLEKEQGIQGLVKYCLFADQKGKWRIQAVAAKQGSFDNRLPLPEPWRGVRDEELSELSGIPGCIFAHASGFIGGNHTLEGVQKMAQLALSFEADAPSKKKGTLARHTSNQKALA